MNWKTLSTTNMLKTKWVSVDEEKVQVPNGKILDYYIVNTGDGVKTFCVTKNKQVVLVKQYKHGIRKEIIELPAGYREPAEKPLNGAARELLEETGYKGKMQPLFTGYYSPTNSHCVTNNFLCTDAEKVAEPIEFENEKTEAVLVPLEEIDEFITSGKLTRADDIGMVYLGLKKLGRL